MTLNSTERIEVRTIDIRGNNGNGFSADFLRGESIRVKRDVLMDMATRIDAATFGKELDEARRGVELRFAFADAYAADVNSTSMVLYRHSNTPPGEIDSYHGYSFQQELEMRIGRETLPVLFWAIRAFEADFRDHGLGRFDIQQGLIRHERTKAILHRTIVPPAAWSVIQSGVVNDRLYYPWLSPYGKVGDPRSLLAQQIMYEGYFILRDAGIAKAKLPPNGTTGVAIADEAPNLAYVPKPDHQPTMDLNRYLTETLKAVPKRGDRVYGVVLLDN